MYVDFSRTALISTCSSMLTQPRPRTQNCICQTAKAKEGKDHLRRTCTALRLPGPTLGTPTGARNHQFHGAPFRRCVSTAKRSAENLTLRLRNLWNSQTGSCVCRPTHLRAWRTVKRLHQTPLAQANHNMSQVVQENTHKNDLDQAEQRT